MPTTHNRKGKNITCLHFQMFKGFDKAKDIQYVYTPVFSSLCGVKLDSNNKAGYLLSGTVMSVLHTLNTLTFDPLPGFSCFTTTLFHSLNATYCELFIAGVVMAQNRKYVEWWQDFYWSVWPGRILGQLITVTEEEPQLQIPDGLWMQSECYFPIISLVLITFSCVMCSKQNDTNPSRELESTTAWFNK